MFVMNDFGLIPGITADRVTQESQVWWGQRERALVFTATCPISSAATDAGNVPTTLLRAGLLLGRITATQLLVPWDPTASDGSQHIYGVLMLGLNMLDATGTAATRYVGWVMIGGNVRASALVIPGESAAGIDGKDKELQVRAALTQTGRFLLDDEFQGNCFGGWQRIVTKAADYTVVEADNNTLFLNSTQAINLTLPAPRPGFRIMIYGIADFTIKVTAAVAGQLIAYNDAAANSVSFETAGQILGTAIEVLGISTSKYIVIVHAWGDKAVANAATITT